MPDIRAQDEKALASVKAIYDAAEQAKNDAQRAHDAADEAEGHAQTALTNAATAKAAADEAQEAADKSLVQLSIIEDVAGTLNWIQEHGTYKATTDTTVQEGKIYFVKNGDDYEPVVNPAGDPHSQGWYVLDLSDSQSDYIMAHLAVTSRGLWVLPSGMGSASDAQYAPNYKALLSSSGLLIYDGNGALVSTFGENITFSATRGQRIGGASNYIEFDPSTGRINIIGSGVYFGSTPVGDVATQSDIPTNVSELTNDSGYQTASDVSSAVSSGVSGKADKTDAVARQQRIYYRKTASGAPSKNTTWLSTSGTGYGNWSLKIPPLTSGSTKYPYLYTAVQTQTVSQQAAGSTCSCSDVLLDESTTVIDGGNIITGSVTANQIAANSITADKLAAGAITIGKMDSSTQSQVLNSNMQIGGRNLLKEFDIWVNATTSGVTRAYTSNGWHKFSGTLALTANSRHALYCGPSFGRTVIAGPGTYTITNWTENLELNSNIYIRVYMYKNDGGTLTNPHNYNLAASNTSGTFTVEDGEYIAAVVLFFMTASSGTSLDNAKLRLKLEKGNKATDWTPAPEDIESSGGRNYAKTNDEVGSQRVTSGVTATVSDYGTVTLNGTATANTLVLSGTKSFGGLNLSVGVYKIWFTNTNGTNIWPRIGKGTSSGYMYSIEGEYTKDSPFLLNVTEEDVYYVAITVKSGTVLSNFTTSIMWERCQTTDFSPAPEDTKNEIALSSRNMLLDWNAPSLTQVDASTARYFGNIAASGSYITGSFIPITDAPEPSIKNGVRFVGNGQNTSTLYQSLAFYGVENLTALPFKNGCQYTISLWARCTSGSGLVGIGTRHNGTVWTDVIPRTILTSEWKRYYGVLNYIDSSDYNRVHFYAFFNANTTGTIEMCGFQCVANGDSAEATSYITSIDSDNGIRVHAANNPTSNYAKIDADGMEVYKGGNKVAKFGQTIELSDGTRTLYEVKPLSGAAKVTRLYNLAYYDGYTERETYYETVHLGRTVSSWSSIILAYKINSTSYTKSYSSLPISDTSGKFTLSISYADSSNAKVNVGINANTTLASTETLTIESLTFNYATTQVAIESTLGAYADTTQSAAFRVGNGTSTNAKSNSFSLDWAGNGYFNGDVYANCDANTSGGVSLGTVQYIPSAFNVDTSEYHMDIGVLRIGMVVMLDITFFRNKSIAAGGNIFNLDISRSDIPMPQTGVATGMAFYNNGTSSRALGIVLGDTDGTGPRIRVYNNGTNNVTISSTQEVQCTMTYICDTFTAAHWDEV